MSRRARSAFGEDLTCTGSQLCADVNTGTQHAHGCTHVHSSVCMCEHICTDMPMCTYVSHMLTHMHGVHTSIPGHKYPHLYLSIGVDIASLDRLIQVCHQSPHLHTEANTHPSCAHVSPHAWGKTRLYSQKNLSELRFGFTTLLLRDILCVQLFRASVSWPIKLVIGCLSVGCKD